MITFSNQLDFIFWRYEGTGNRTTRKKEWEKYIVKDFINFLINNDILLLYISSIFNTSQIKVKKRLFLIWSLI